MKGPLSDRPERLFSAVLYIHQDSKIAGKTRPWQRFASCSGAGCGSWTFNVTMR